MGDARVRFLCGLHNELFKMITKLFCGFFPWLSTIASLHGMSPTIDGYQACKGINAKQQEKDRQQGGKRCAGCKYKTRPFFHNMTIFHWR